MFAGVCVCVCVCVSTLFLPHYCLQLVACIFQVRGITVFNKQIPKCLVKLSIYKLCVLYLPTHEYLRMRINMKLVY